MVTVTPGRTAPLVSVTRPLNSAVDNCADAAAAVRSKVSAPRTTFRRKPAIQPPLLCGFNEASCYLARSLATRENAVNGCTAARILLRLWRFAEGIFSQDWARPVRHSFRDSGFV